jgi:hypothetical protein
VARADLRSRRKIDKDRIEGRSASGKAVRPEAPGKQKCVDDAGFQLVPADACRRILVGLKKHHASTGAECMRPEVADVPSAL